MKRRGVIFMLLFGTALLASGLWLMRAVEPPILTAEAADISALQEAAIASCICRREGKPEDACTAMLNTARTAMLKRAFGDTGPPPNMGDASACAPISTSSECYEFADGLHCITTGYDVIGASRDIPVREVCTLNEARAIENAQHLGWLGDDGEPPNPENPIEWQAANDRSSAALNEMLRSIIAGDPIPSAPQSDGCAG